MLHTVNKSPFERNTLTSCLRIAKPGSAVLLIEDGVYGAMSEGEHATIISSRMEELNFYVLGPDINARGLGNKPLIDGINVIDYGGFVDLTTEHDAVNSWL
jgi:tRNA 2-thiouridine synthesizing protein B